MLQSKLNEYGEEVNRWVEPLQAEPKEPLSKNQKRKAKRYAKLTAVAKGGKGIQSEYYNFFDSHNICRNPRTILIAMGY